MKKLLILISAFTIFTPTLAAAGNISIPGTTGELLSACRVAAKNNFRSYSDAFDAAYCHGILKGYINAKFEGSIMTPGYDIQGFVKAAERIHYAQLSKNSMWATFADVSLVAMTFKDESAGVVQCKGNPEQLCLAPGKYTLFGSM